MFVLVFSAKEIFQYKTKLYLPASCSQAKIHVSATLWCLHKVYGKHAYLVALWAIKTNQTEDLTVNILVWILPIQIAQVVTTDIVHTQKEANLKTCRFTVLLYVLLLLALNASLAYLIFFCIFQLHMCLQRGECKCLVNGHSNTVYSTSNVPFSLFKAFRYHWYSGYKNFSIRDKLEQPSDMKAFPLYVGECCYNPARLRFSLVT